MSKDLRLPLKTKWFNMTKSGVKTEDYREINDYWLKRLFYHDDPQMVDQGMIDEVLCELKERRCFMSGLYFWAGWKSKQFDHNIMTLGYPHKDDTDRVITLKHEGIEIRQGNPDWGAEQGKIYFVIKHGDRV